MFMAVGLVHYRLVRRRRRAKKLLGPNHKLGDYYSPTIDDGNCAEEPAQFNLILDN